MLNVYILLFKLQLLISWTQAELPFDYSLPIIAGSTQNNTAQDRSTRIWTDL